VKQWPARHHALIGDYFPLANRGKALSVIGLRLTGVIVAMAGGGLISDWRGWRVAFYLGGLPGLILSGLVLFTIRDALAAALVFPFMCGHGHGRHWRLRTVRLTLWFTSHMPA
jgi:MFS family permease